MTLQPKRFDHLLGGRAKGLSDRQLEAHFELYRGYVKKLNEIWERLAKSDRSGPNYSFSDYSELRRREPVAYNGTVLHEAYFENLGDGSAAPSEETKQALASSFGSFDAWLEDAKACLMSAHGWLLIVHDPLRNAVVNNLVRSEHDVGLFAGATILAAVDAWEHAYFFDYQTRKAEYVQNVLSGLNWRVIEERLALAVGAAKARPARAA